MHILLSGLKSQVLGLIERQNKDKHKHNTLHARTFAKLTDLQPNMRAHNNPVLRSGMGSSESSETNAASDRPRPHENERDTLPVRHRPIAKAAERATRTFHRRRARTHPDSNKSSRPYQAKTAPRPELFFIARASQARK